MKCVFDGQLKSQDTVLLTLYKRMFPKWTYNAVVSDAVSNTGAAQDESVTDADDSMNDSMTS